MSSNAGLTLGAGAVFGVMWGSIYVSIAATLCATCAFLVGRYLARDAIARKIEGNERFAASDKAANLRIGSSTAWVTETAGTTNTRYRSESRNIRAMRTTRQPSSEPGKFPEAIRPA